MISIIRAVGNWAVPLFQIITLLIVAVAADQIWEEALKWPILFGGVVSVVNLLWLQWRLRRSEKRQPTNVIEQDVEQSAHKITADLYMTAVERFVLVVALFLLGMVKLQLEPMALMIGFIVGQLVMLIGSSQLGSGLSAENLSGKPK